MLKKVIKKTPIIGTLARNIKRAFFAEKFTNSEEYWDKRYIKGGNSGAGSYNHLAKFKSEVINSFIDENNIETIIEFGSGDGNQLKYMNYKSYIGFDVSNKAIELCKNIYADDISKTFTLVQDYNNEKAQVTLSLDVIYHLVEDNVFEEYMKLLFKASQKYVIIYSSNHDDNTTTRPHVKNRNFTDWISKNEMDFKLIGNVKNKYGYKEGLEKTTSIADFYFYKKTN